MILTCFSCKKNTASIEVSDEIIGIESSVRYAQGFDLQIFQDISKLVIKRPYPNAQNQEVFYLVPSNNFIPDSLQNKNVIRTPIGSAVPTSTTHIPMIELFNMEDKDCLFCLNADRYLANTAELIIVFTEPKSKAALLDHEPVPLFPAASKMVSKTY